jgi:uncharacterized protein YndB with AHSA1/START domain
MTTARSRVVASSRERVWDVVGDPWHEPRWWPHVQRVEGVGRDGWTSVLVSARGTAVRVDWTVEATERPVRRRWRQELGGTPFERLFTRYAIEVELEGVEAGTAVTLRLDQRPRGLARLTPWLLMRAARQQLDTALEGLAGAVEGRPA